MGKVTPLTDADRRQIIDLYTAGTLVVDIQAATGRCRASVYAVIKEAAIATRNSPGQEGVTPCIVCGKPTRYIAPSLRAKGIGKYCSRACMGEAKRLADSCRAAIAEGLLCTRCGIMKPVTDFYPHKRIARGAQYWCKDCGREKRRERAGIPQDPKLTRKYKLKEAYGITPETYDTLYAAQGGRCAICDDPHEPWQPSVAAKDRKRFLVVDHDHKTGRIRGLLCTNCNCGIGQMRDDPMILWAAMTYLETG